eukprot:6961790-Pyramimonas_sp.AAC.1
MQTAPITLSAYPRRWSMFRRETAMSTVCGSRTIPRNDWCDRKEDAWQPGLLQGGVARSRRANLAKVSRHSSTRV